MSGSVKALLGVAALLMVGAAAVLLLDEGPGPAPMTAGAVRVAGSGDSARDTELPPGMEGDRSRLDAAAAQPAALLDGAGLVAGPDATAAVAADLSAPKLTLSGRVVDPAGRPVASARVVFHAPGHDQIPRLLGRDSDRDGLDAPPETSTNSQGEFSLEARLPDDDTSDADGRFRPRLNDGNGRVAVAHPSFRTLVQECPRLHPGELDLGVLPLEFGASISGRVVDEQGRSVASATVRGRNDAELSSGGLMRMLGMGLAEQYSSSTTSADGRFLVTGLGAGSASVSASAPGRQMAEVQDVQLEATLSTDVGELMLAMGESIAGWVLDDKGQPVLGAEIRVSSMARIVLRDPSDMPRRQLGNEFSLRAETDRDGHFEIVGMASGQFTVHVSADGFARLDRENVRTGTRDLRLTVAPLGGLLVTVLDSRDGSPVSAVQLSAHPLADGPFEMVLDDVSLPVLAGAAAL